MNSNVSVENGSTINTQSSIPDSTETDKEWNLLSHEILGENTNGGQVYVHRPPLPCQLALTNDCLTIRFTSLKGSSSQSVDISWVRILKCNFLPRFQVQGQLEEENVGLQLTMCLTPLQFQVITRSNKLPDDSDTLLAIRSILLFKHFPILSDNGNYVVNFVQLARDNMEAALWTTKYFDSPEMSQPYLLILNPKAGPGNAMTLFRQNILPIFMETNVNYQLICTEYRFHAQELMRKCDVSKYRGIVAISGDGLLNEIINGLLQRGDWRYALENTRLGIIAAGSGNALASSLLHDIGMKPRGNLAFHSGLLLCRPQVYAMDLAMVEFAVPRDLLKERQYEYSHYHYDPSRTKWDNKENDKIQKTVVSCASLLTISWGLIADVDIGSEWLRFLGGIRFTITAAYKIMRLPTYRGRLQYLPADPSILENGDQVNSMTFSKNRQAFQLNEVLINKSSGLDSHPLNRINVLDPSSIFQTDEIDRDTPDYFEWRYLPSLNEPIPDNSEWVTREENFTAIAAVYQTHITNDILASPQSKFSDGLIYLFVLHGNPSRSSLFNILVNMEDGKHLDLPNCQLIPTKAFRLTPLERDGRICVDGEIIPYGPVQAEVASKATRLVAGQKEFGFKK